MRIHHRIARTRLWLKGRRVLSTNKQGFSLNRRFPFSPQEGFIEDSVFCEKGEMYYTWHPKGLPWQFSKTRPDLRTEWQITFQDFDNRVSSLDAGEMFGEEIDKDELRSEIEEYQSQLQSNLESMPGQLQESSILNERIEELQNLLDQLED